MECSLEASQNILSKLTSNESKKLNASYLKLKEKGFLNEELQNSDLLSKTELSDFEELASIDESTSTRSVEVDEDIIKLLNTKEGEKLLRNQMTSSASSEALLDLEIEATKGDNVSKKIDQAITSVKPPEFVLEKLKSVFYFTINFHSVELINFSNFSTLWVEYTFPGFKGHLPQGRFRTAVSQPKVTNKIKGPSPTLIKLNHSVNLPICFDQNMINEWNDPNTGNANIKVIGIQIAGNKRAKLSSLPESSNNLLNLYGKVKCCDLFVARDFEFCCDVALFSNGREKSSEIDGSISLSISINPELKNSQTEHFSSSLINQPIISTSKDGPLNDIKLKSPCYLYFHLGRARALSVPYLSTNSLSSIPMFLRIRLFSANHNVIETPPISYLNPFITASIEDDITDFDFGHTMPLALSTEFIEKYEKTPIIVEVNTIVRSNEQTKEQLLGLAYLPFEHIFAAFMSTIKSSQPQTIDINNLQIPDTEYIIRDPFTGKSRGWIHGFISIGTWDQVFALRKTFQKTLQPGPTIITHPLPEKVPKHIKSLDQKPKDSSQAPDVIPGTSVVGVTVHRACGIRGLLMEYLNHTEDKSIIHSLEYAIENGANVFVQIDLFPNDLINEQIIETPTSDSSFTPIFEFSADVILHGINTGVILWMKKGGFAEGKVWHKIPGHLLPSNLSQTCLLGTFKIPLDSLLSKRNGISKQWFPIDCALSNRNAPRAALEVSLKFEDSELGYLNESIYTHNTYDSLKLNVTVQNIILGTIVDSNSPVFVMWKFQDSDLLDWQYSKSKALQPSNKSPNLLSTFSFAKQEIEISLFGSKHDLLNNNGIIEFRVLMDNKEAKNSENYIGSALVDITQLFSETKRFHRSRSSAIRPCYQQSHQIINPLGADLGNSSIDVKVELELSRFTSLFKSSLPKITSSIGTPDKSLELQQLANPLPAIDMITLCISVEKAMNLPLMNDPLASSLVSPFSRPDQINNSPPNAFVTFPSSINLENNSVAREFQSHVVAGEIAPSWKIKESIKFPKTLNSFLELKNKISIEFSVWHAFDTSIKKWRDLTANDKLSGCISDDKRKLIGKAIVHLAPLFAGLYEIHGWYPILGRDSSRKGQLLVRIRPSENLEYSLKKISGATNTSPKRFKLFNPIKGDDILNSSLLNTHKSNTFFPAKSISEAMHELDLLNSKMLERLEKRNFGSSMADQHSDLDLDQYQKEVVDQAYSFNLERKNFPKLVRSSVFDPVIENAADSALKLNDLINETQSVCNFEVQQGEIDEV